MSDFLKLEDITETINEWNTINLKYNDCEFNDKLLRQLKQVINRDKKSMELSDYQSKNYQMLTNDINRKSKQTFGDRSMNIMRIPKPDEINNWTLAQLEELVPWRRLEKEDKIIHINAYIREKNINLPDLEQLKLSTILSNSRTCKKGFMTYDKINKRIKKIHILARNDDTQEYYIDKTRAYDASKDKKQSGKVYDSKLEKRMEKINKAKRIFS